MHSRFVGISNVKAFMSAVRKIDDRGAPEAGFVLVQGLPGRGKTSTAQWWATQNDAIFVRVTAATTPHWVLKDIVRELGEAAPARSCEALHDQAVSYLAKNPRTIVLDEVENALENIKVLHAVRDISDMVEVPVVLIGREYVWDKLKRHGPIRSRIGERAFFGPLTLGDVRLCAEELLVDLKIDAHLVNELHAQSDGLVRKLLNGLKNIERYANGKSTFTRADLGNRPLVVDQARATQVDGSH